MATSATAFSVRLQYNDAVFPGQDWNNFLKNCSARRYNSRQGDWWASIRGKGFIIWISCFCSQREGPLVTWFSTIELSSTAPALGFQTLEEFIAGALHNFKKMSVIAPQNYPNQLVV
jgi:hypothetical protein